MKIVCQQKILMKYHALFVIFEKAAKFFNFKLVISLMVTPLSRRLPDNQYYVNPRSSLMS